MIYKCLIRGAHQAHTKNGYKNLDLGKQDVNVYLIRYFIADSRPLSLKKNIWPSTSLLAS